VVVDEVQDMSVAQFRFVVAVGRGGANGLLYKWQTKQVVELLRDLSSSFFRAFREGDSRSEVARYGRYFLAPIILSQKDGHQFIVDCQQRLTTLTRLPIYLHNLQRERPDGGRLTDLISERFGDKSFNLDVRGWTGGVEAIFNNQEFDIRSRPEPVR
jgi:hypothetical protein